MHFHDFQAEDTDVLCNIDVQTASIRALQFNWWDELSICNPYISHLADLNNILEE